MKEFCTAVFLFSVLASPQFAHAGVDAEVGLKTGYRVDDFDWNIAGSIEGTGPNVLSELEWDDLDIFLVTAQGQLAVPVKNAPFSVALRSRISYGEIVSGDNRDADYLGDNRTLEFSRSENNADDGDLWETSVAVGLRFSSSGQKLWITPLVGYAYREQTLTMSDGTQVVPDLGPFDGLHNTYEYTWSGPFAGLDLGLEVNTRLSLQATVEFHQADFEADANWNLRTDLAHPLSFRHDAEGEGVLATLNARYALSPRWSMDLELDYQTWDADNGTDRVFFSDGTSAVTRLNEVNQSSSAVLIGVNYRFD